MSQINSNGSVLNIRFVLNFDKFKEICINGNVNNSTFNKTKTGRGVELVDWKCEDPNNGDSISMLLKFNSNRNEVSAEPFQLKSRGFIDGPITAGFMETLQLLVFEGNGDLAGYDTSFESYLVVDGKAEKSDFAVVKEGSTVAIELEEEEEDDTTHFKVNVSIKEYLTNNPDVASELKSLGCTTMEQKLNALGKKLIQLKLQDEISYTLFIDLFRQCGLLGATDPAVVRFYKLLT